MRRVRVAKERLYFKEIKRGRALGIKKEETGHLKSMENQKGNTEKRKKQPAVPTQAER
jgi:hypothetical protein